MGKKITSYQKLKERNKNLSDKINRLLSDPEYLATEIMSNNLYNEMNKRVLFGDHKPTGKVKFKGLFSELFK